jgi:hypothetical protein
MTAAASWRSFTLSVLEDVEEEEDMSIDLPCWW